ncbi:MAG TPA: hypothetical protein VI796_05085 [Candidatus Thermoplasmatota archaeon]|nr:hypothetical protein [Candidatus Thermoplasmatota archaeon]
MDVQACLRCGSRNLHMLTLRDGLWPEGGESLKWVCGECDWQGAPLLLDGEGEWRAFAEALRSASDRPSA